MFIEQLLRDAAGQSVPGDLIFYPSGNKDQPNILSYRQLLKEAENASRVVSSILGFRRGRVVLVHFNDHYRNILWFWAIVIARGIPAMSTPFSLVPEQRRKHIEHLGRTLEDPIWLTCDDLLDQFAETSGLTIQNVDDAKTLDRCSPVEGNDIGTENNDDLQMLLLTSGSTGNAKAVVIDGAQVEAALSGKLGLTKPTNYEVIQNWIAFDHVAAFEAHFVALRLNSRQLHIPASDVIEDPLWFLASIARHRVTKAFAPNFFFSKLRKVLDENPSLELDLSTWRVCISGGEPCVVETCETLTKTLVQYGAPKDLIVPGFGMTESLAGSIYSLEIEKDFRADFSNVFARVGKPVTGMQMRIVEESEDFFDIGGELQIKGPNVFNRYYNNPEATKEAFTADGWFKTGDRGLIDVDGSLLMTGRKKETILINGTHYYPQDIEAEIEAAEIPGITPTFALCFDYRTPRMDTDKLCVVYLPSHDSDDIAAAAGTYSAIAKIVTLQTRSRPCVLPLDASLLHKSSLGKLPRAKIRAAFLKGELFVKLTAHEDAIHRWQASDIMPPTNDAERQVRSIVSGCLGIPECEVGVDRDLFEVGMTSMELLATKSKLQQLLLRNIDMGIMLRNRTVRDLALVLQESNAIPAYNPVHVLQPNGPKTPLWLVHPGVGDVLVFMELAQHITDRPVYALRARGFEDGEKCFESLDELTTVYRDAIRAYQPSGPYALAGYCYGAMLAFEVSKLLQVEGEEIAFLGSFDLPPHVAWRMRQLDWAACLAHLAFFVDLMDEPASIAMLPQLRALTHIEAIRHVQKLGDAKRWDDLALSEAALQSWVDVAHQLHVIAVDYEPKGSVPSVDVFYAEPLTICASTKEAWAAGPLQDWQEFSRAELVLHDCPGGHYTMMGPVWVKKFHLILKKALAARGI